METKLHTTTNVKTARRSFLDGFITVTLRYDDTCRNGHNTLSITGSYDTSTGSGAGRVHDEIGMAFPDLKPLLKWHGCHTDGPLHYVANTVYYVKEGNLDLARETAIWPDATDEDLCREGLEDRLKARLPALMQDFRKVVESLGFIY